MRPPDSTWLFSTRFPPSSRAASRASAAEWTSLLLQSGRPWRRKSALDSYSKKRTGETSRARKGAHRIAFPESEQAEPEEARSGGAERSAEGLEDRGSRVLPLPSVRSSSALRSPEAFDAFRRWAP